MGLRRPFLKIYLKDEVTRYRFREMEAKRGKRDHEEYLLYLLNLDDEKLRDETAFQRVRRPS